MGIGSIESHRPYVVAMRLPRLLVAAALMAVLVAGLIGCTGPEAPEEPPTDPEAAGTPLPAYDLRGVALERSPYCERIAATGVVAALDGSAADAETWDNGDRVTLDDGRDVAHEYGCRYSRDGATAETWLFAPPVTERRAASLARAARKSDGCRDAGATATFGRPSVALVCDGPDGPSASYRGLFGDAWLVCGLSRTGVPRPQLVELAGRWCVEAVTAARAD